MGKDLEKVRVKGKERIVIEGKIICDNCGKSGLTYSVGREKPHQIRKELEKEGWYFQSLGGIDLCSNCSHLSKKFNKGKLNDFIRNEKTN